MECAKYLRNLSDRKVQAMAEDLVRTGLKRSKLLSACSLKKRYI